MQSEHRTSLSRPIRDYKFLALLRHFLFGCLGLSQGLPCFLHVRSLRDAATVQYHRIGAVAKVKVDKLCHDCSRWQAFEQIA